MDLREFQKARFKLKRTFTKQCLKMIKYLTVVFLGFLSLCAAEKFRFDNYTLYKIQPKSFDHINLLRNLQNTDLRYDFWNDPVPSKEFVNILSSPEYKGDLEGLLNGNGIKFEITMSNIQE